jgi:hypothetical protein
LEESGNNVHVGPGERFSCFEENALLIISTGMRPTVTVKEKEDAVRAFAFEVALNLKLGAGGTKDRSPKMLLNKENVRI